MTAAPVVEFTRVEAGVYATGPYVIKREQIGGGIGRAPVMTWRTYRDGIRDRDDRTLAAAQAAVRRMIEREV